MARRCGVWAVTIAAIALIAATAYLMRSASALRAESADAPQWDLISHEQAGLPEIGREELLAHVRNWVQAAGHLEAWEARYEAGFAQFAPSVRETARVRMVSAAPNWAVHLQTNSDDNQTMGIACDGSTVRILWPERKQAQLLKAGERIGLGGMPTLPGFLPQLSSEEVLSQNVDMRDMLGMFDSAETALSASCMRVDGNPCYILEQTQTREYPVFQSQEQADQWRREHANEGAYSDGSVRPIIVINPSAKPDQKVTSTITLRAAVDPALGFAVVRWARDGAIQMPGQAPAAFRAREVAYHDFRRIVEGLSLPSRMELAIYHQTAAGRPEVFQRFTLTVEDFIVRPQCEASLFAPAVPKGYDVIDAIRQIAYTAGDSQEKLDALIAGAAARDAFYRRLWEGPAPALHGSAWINSDAIDPAEYKGRPIVLYFWSITCGACMGEMPHMQAQYGDTLKSTNEPLFLSIHPFAEGEDLKRVRQVVKDRGITFPVMIDAPHTNRRYWGDTHYRYRIFGQPSEIRIAEDGRVVEDPGGLISESSWWVGEARDG